MSLLEVNIDNKYGIVIEDDYTMYSTRYGKFLDDHTHNNLIFAMAHRIEELEERIKELGGVITYE